MKVLNLQCTNNHSFEGWFGSEADFQSQLTRGLVECPICNEKGIQKMPSAPRLNLGGHEVMCSGPNHSDQQLNASDGGHQMAPQKNDTASGSSTGIHRQAGTSLSEQAVFLKALRHVVADTEDVGDRFANEARAMYYGDSEARSIRGRANPREAVELLQEGIDVLPLPAQLNETLQ